MPTLTLTLPKPHDAQRQIISEARRFNAVACGRRFGKTVLLSDRLVHPALQGHPVAYLAPTYKMMQEVWREMCDVLAPVISRTDASEKRLELVTGGVLDMWSFDAIDSMRGRKYKLVCGDEAAMVEDLLDKWSKVVRPTLTDLEGSAWFGSTPRGRNGFWHMFNWGQDPENEDWASWQMPTLSNPYIKPAEVEAAKRGLPEAVFSQEYAAKFLEFEGAVFRRLEAAAKAERLEQAEAGHEYVMGVDWGRHNDFTVLTVLDVASLAQVHMDRFTEIDYPIQRARLTALHERFNCRVILAESNSMGEPIIEELQKEGLPVQAFTTTNATKAEAIQGLALAFERGQITILDDPVLMGELMAYEATKLPSGLMRYSAPEGMHDDTVMSLALAHAATTRSGTSWTSW